MPKPVPQNILNRLILAKSFYLYGKQLCMTRNDLNKFSMGIVLFHDAVDNLLGAIASYLNIIIPPRKDFLLATYNEINSYLKSKKLKQLPSNNDLKVLNTLRNQIKHQGILPNQQVNFYLIKSIEQFIEMTVRRFFKINFLAVSLADSIRNNKIKLLIKDCEKLIAKRKYSEGLMKMAIIFFDFFEKGYILRKKNIEWFVRRGDKKTFEEYVAEEKNIFPDKELHWHHIQLLEVGIDPFLYYRFKNIVGDIGYNNYQEKRLIHKPSMYWHKYNWTKENCLFCYNFLIDAIIKQQGEEYRGYTLVNYWEKFIDYVIPKEDVSIYTPDKSKILHTLKKEQKIYCGIISDKYYFCDDSTKEFHFYRDRKGKLEENVVLIRLHEPDILGLVDISKLNLGSEERK